ncbi:DNA primase [Gracilibacillus halotolerans]|uniref:DNA primase n=1 Tax=Gracilibacillus halotolerans TaxID=74386 RepID=A0A841RJJ1_9BACI|nr:DNA primase [Gracilibacillus halotolerans]MBB6511813.1 DNA primase [Gracilibacillus halotolerans]
MSGQTQVSNDLIDEIRRSNDVVDIVGEYVQLKKRGRNYFGLCPFHSENTPSFSVNQEKQIFNCFGCSKGGNVITFIMEIEGFSFHQALQHLANKSGHSIPQFEHAQEQTNNHEDQTVLEAYGWLTKLYHHLLRRTKDGKEAKEYLYERGFTNDTINEFKIGYSPSVKDFVVQFLEKKGIHKQIMVKAGLLKATESNDYVDRFQGRVIFPISNHLGKTIGFGGRSLTDRQEPKYLNSPESSLFRKSKLLFNFDKARSEIRKKEEVILMEGYADVIIAYQSGLKNTVASLGTSLTESHATLLRRYVDNVIICYDGDEAGINASYKALQLLRKTGCNVKVTVIPDGLDPDQYIREYGKDTFHQLVYQQSMTEMQFIMYYFRKDFRLSQEGERLRYVEKVLEHIAFLETSVERDYYLRELAEEFNLSLDSLKEDLNQRMQKSKKSDDNKRLFGNTNGGYQHQHQQISTKRILPAYQNAERRLLSYMLTNHYIAEKVKNKIGSRFNLEEHQIIVTYLYGYYEEGNEPSPSDFITYLPDQHLQHLVVELTMNPVDWEVSDRELEDYIHLILSEQTEQVKIKRLKEEQKSLEKTDPLKAAQIAMEIIKIKQSLNK